MKKIAIAAFASMFIFGSTATMASGNLESSLTPVSAENVMNWMNCKGKGPDATVKSMTKVKDGKIVVVKCSEINKIIADAEMPVSDY
jgi:hypothetical protein